MIDDPLIRMTHTKALKLCNGGVRDWIEAHNLSWPTFVQRGYPASVFEATGDAQGIEVAAYARRVSSGRAE